MPGSAEMIHEASPLGSGLNSSQSKPNKTSPNSSNSLDSMSFKVLERKSVDNSHFLEKRSTVSEMQQQLNQLQEELRKEKEEKSRAMEELTQVKKKKLISERGAIESKAKIEALDREVERARQSERRMLESLVSQTKLLEETKISHEEARLELKSFKENNTGLDISKVIGNWSSRNLGKYLPLEKYLPLPLNGLSSTVHAEEDKLLRSAIEAEEHSKKAMDDLTVTLKEVMTEANLSKERLSMSQSELEKVRAEAESLKSLLKRMEEKFQAAAEESEKLRLEFDESTATWNAKESGFIDCIKMSEEELIKAKEDNDKLFDSQRVIREENAKLRDILKQAVSEASVVKESLEIARRENSQLKHLLSEKENKLQGIKQEYESLKVSEAAATDSVKELKSLLAATSELDSIKTVPAALANNSFRQSDSSNFTSSLEGGAFRLSETKVDDNKSIHMAPKFSSERWSGGNSRVRGMHRHSAGEQDKFTDPTSNMVSSTKQNDRMFASLSNISEMRATQLIVIGDTQTFSPEDFDHIDDHHSEKRKKKPIFRKFGDMLKRSVQKKY